MTDILIKERPILFSGAMVRALLAGSKTQTRRIVNPQPTEEEKHPDCFRFNGPLVSKEGPFGILAHCPYGRPGERLWVRETFWEYGQWVQLGVTDAGKKVRSFAATDIKARPIRFAAPDENTYLPGEESLKYYKRPSIFMPRAASRLLLEITAVRCERLQDISEADAWAEGCQRGEPTDNGGHFPAEQPDPSGIGERGWDSAKDWYADLWEEINGPDSWAANPWVWVVEFKVIEPA